MITREFLTSLEKDSRLNIENLVILTCAIFIASIGLNMNSTATIIGAMLISPLMSPLLAIGTGIATYQTDLMKKGAFSLLAEVAISLAASTTYFFLSPLTFPSQEILARTSPTIWDVLIAFFGGIAGIIGATKRGANNIVPGVAIATALMPPLCAAGYGLGTSHLHFFVGAFYLFTINAIFIMLTAFAGVKVMRWLSQSNTDLPHLWRLPVYQVVLFVAAMLVLIVPSVFSTQQLVQRSMAENNVHQLVATEFPNDTIIKEEVNNSSKVINLTISGSRETTQRVKRLKKRLADYHLTGYSLNVIQVAWLDAATEAQLNARVTNIVNRQRQAADDKEKRRLAKQEKRNKKIAALSEDISTVTAVSNDHQQETVIVELKKQLSQRQQVQLTTQIKKHYPTIDRIEYVVKAD